MNKNKRLETRNRLSPLTVFLLAVLALYVVVLIAIFAWVFLTASKSYDLDYKTFDGSGDSNIFGLPKQFVLFENIMYVYDGFADFSLLDMFMNTMLYAVGCSMSKAIVTCIVAYLCARYENWFSKIIYTVVIVTMIVPVVGSQAAEFQLVQQLNFRDNMIGMWLMRANFLGMYFLVFYAVFKAMPKGYYEAARIDGANDFQVMVKVALPLAKLTFLSIFLILFIEYWNDYLIPNYYLPNYKTLSLALYQQSRKQGLDMTSGVDISQVTYLMTTALCVTVPIVLIFAFFSKRLMGNMSVGGLKG
ncbi:MAG: carbohydrate ABC transporter permease [Clostridia bacterium]|nr:carbohydrate ABC transporter permease [Clostridia bacterium]